MKILSMLATRVRYTHPVGSAPFPQEHITLYPGHNIVPDDAGKRLVNNSLFKIHLHGGYVSVLPTEAPPAAPPAPAVTVWTRRKGETDKVYAARVAALDSFVATVNGLPEAEQTAILGAASDDEKAALTTPKPKE